MIGKSTQTPSSILMIRPVKFGFNDQTAGTNAFQQKDVIDPKKIHDAALAEFDAFVEKLRNKGVNVIVFEDTLEPHKPDSIFPNNWVSFHEDGTVVLYPMHAENRRLERRDDILSTLQEKYHFEFQKVVDLSYYEKENRFLEGTGSIVFDYENRIAYTNHSKRSDFEILKRLAEAIEFKVLVFDAVDRKGSPIYHTNVLMCIGHGFAVICLDSIPKEDEKRKVKESLEITDHEVIHITFEQLYNFAGNMLQVQSLSGEKILVMSQQAYNSLTEVQIEQLSKHTQILPVDITTIEKYGGGSARCMMAGIHTSNRKVS